MTGPTERSKVDVLIIGSGPAGLMCALWMARLGIKARIVDKRSAKVYTGQADGLQVRSLEILDSFGIGERVWKEASHMIETTFWNADKDGGIQRDLTKLNGLPELSRFCEVVLHQGRVEQFFLDAIKGSYGDADDGDADGPWPVHVERCILPTELTIDETLVDDEHAYPVSVTLRHLSEEEASPRQKLSNIGDGLFRSNLVEDDTPDLMAKSRAGLEEKVLCKYVVGCDGAHSWTRKTLGYSMVGEMTDYIWGVMDIVPITDFPDIRTRAMVHSGSSGSLMVIPRENRLVRLYIELTEVSAGGGRLDRARIDLDMILQAARKTLSPYKLDYHYCDWWTAYQVGQRVGERFSKSDRVFLAGDAVHTHSPKAGQGMNTSMQDTYNLGWKLGLVCHKVLRRDVLSTYEFERRMVAMQLIKFDQGFYHLVSEGLRKVGEVDDEDNVSSDAFVNSHLFTTAVGINYQPSVLVAKPPGNDFDRGIPVVTVDQAVPSPARSILDVATGCRPGKRFPSHQVVAQADGRPWTLHHKMPSDGRFRLVVFAGDIGAEPQRRTVNRLGAWLVDSLLPRVPAAHFMRHLSASAADPNGGSTVRYPTAKTERALDVLLVHSTRRHHVEMLRDLHEAYHPFDPKLGWDYGKIFVDGPSHHQGHGHAYERYGVHAERGALVLVRPDGCVGLVAPLSDEGQVEVEKWLCAVLRMD